MKITTLLAKIFFLFALSNTVIACGTSAPPAAIASTVPDDSNVAATSTMLSVSSVEIGTSPQNPASMTEVVTSENFEYSILEVLRNDQAWNLLKDASAFNKPPADASMEYILVRLQIRSLENNDQTLSIDPAHVEGVIESDGGLLDRPSIVDIKTPEPVFQAELEPGDTAEGWVTLLAPKNGTDLVLVIQPRVNGLSLGNAEIRYIALQ